MNWFLVAILGVINLPVFFLAGRWIFGDWEGFGDSLYFWNKSDWQKALDGEQGEDTSGKMLLFTIVLIGTIALEYGLIAQYQPVLLKIHLGWFLSPKNYSKIQEFIHFYSWDPYIFFLLLFLGLPFYWLLIRLLFGGMEGFGIVLKHSRKPDILSWSENQYDQDYAATNAFIIFIFICALIVFVEYTLYQLYFFLVFLGYL